VEWGPILEKIRQVNPRVIVNFDWVSANQAAFTQQFMADPIPGLLYLQWGPADPSFIESLGEKANHVIWSIAFTSFGKNEEAVELNQKFSERWGYESAPSGLSGYGSVYFYKKAVEDAGTTEPRAVAAAILKIKAFPVAYGHLEIDPMTHVCKYGSDYIPAAIHQVQNLKHVVVFPTALAGDEHYIKQPWEP